MCAEATTLTDVCSLESSIARPQGGALQSMSRKKSMWLHSAHMSRDNGSARHRKGSHILGKGPCPPQLCMHLLVGMGGDRAGSCGIDTAGKLLRALLNMTHSHEGHPANPVV